MQVIFGMRSFLVLLLPEDVGLYFVPLVWFHIGAIALASSGLLNFDWAKLGVLYPLTYMACVLCKAFGRKRSAPS